MLSRQEVINRYRTEHPSESPHFDDEAIYLFGAQKYKDEEIEHWDEAYKQYPTFGGVETQGSDNTSPGFVNSLWEMADYGVDEGSPKWLKQAYNYSLTGKAQELITGKPKYEIGEYNPGFWEDIGTTVVSFLYPAA